MKWCNNGDRVTGNRATSAGHQLVNLAPHPSPRIGNIDKIFSLFTILVER